MSFLKKSNLRQLILVLAMLSTLATVINMYLTGSKVQRQALINSTLQSNEAYAIKLADSTQVFLESVKLDLTYSADAIARHWHDPNFLKQEIFRIAKQNQVFNSVIIANAKGVILNSSNSAIELIGSSLSTEGTIASLKSKQAYISQPYESALNNLIIMISHPIYTEGGTYLGFVAGTIYLKEKNVLNRLLGEHYYQNGSYIYVVDQQRRLLFHPDAERLGTAINENVIIDKAINGESGHARIHNSEGIDMLSGYAHIPAANWGVVSQRPIELTLDAHDGLMEKVILNSLPINLLVLAFIWLCAWLISNPLRKLASNAKNMRSIATIKHVQDIHAWYFEANQLKTAFLFGLQNVHDQVGQLRQDVRTDPLTGLHNRRVLDYVLDKHSQSQTSFSVISTDIDHFKRVNDGFGHDVGDVVLKELAKIMLANSREKDYCIRVGGEEFVIILPHASLATATEIANRLRQAVASHDFPTVGKLTISLGVAEWPAHDPDTVTVLKLADNMLYAAKQNGRNQVQVAPLPSAPAL